jgi:hypothetical protein
VALGEGHRQAYLGRALRDRTFVRSVTDAGHAGRWATREREAGDVSERVGAGTETFRTAGEEAALELRLFEGEWLGARRGRGRGAGARDGRGPGDRRIRSLPGVTFVLATRGCDEERYERGPAG